MEVPDPNVTNAPAPENDMAKHFSNASNAVVDLLEATPPDPNDRDQMGATPNVPENVEPPIKKDESAPAPEEPVLPKAGESPAAPPTGESDEAFQKELDVKLPKNAHPNTAKALNTIKAVAERERARANELAKEKAATELRYAELEKQSQGQMPKEEIEELKKLRRSLDIKTDPEFKGKYTTPIEAGNKRASTILNKHNLLSPEVMEDINKLGGLSSAARSSDRVPAELDQKQPTWSQWIDQELLPSVPSVDRNRLQSIIATNADLEDAMQSEMDAIASDPSTFEEKITKRNMDQLEVGINEAKVGIGRMAEHWDVPAGATPEQKAVVDKHNARYEKARAAVETMAQSIVNNPRMQGRAALLMGQAVYLAEANSELVTVRDAQAAQIKKLSDELTAIKKSGSITASLNSLTPSKTNEQTVQTLPDAKAAVAGYMSELDQ